MAPMKRLCQKGIEECECGNNEQMKKQMKNNEILERIWPNSGECQIGLHYLSSKIVTYTRQCVREYCHFETTTHRDVPVSSPQANASELLSSMFASKNKFGIEISVGTSFAKTLWDAVKLICFIDMSAVWSGNRRRSSSFHRLERNWSTDISPVLMG